MMADFCGIPLVSLRENSITELDLDRKEARLGYHVPGTRLGYNVGMAGAIVLSKLLPSAAALKSLMCTCHSKTFAFVSAIR